MAQVPPEVYLRQFRDADAADLDALAELCSLGYMRTLNFARPYADLPIHTNAQWERALAELGRLQPRWEPWWGDERQREEVWNRHSGFPVHAAEVAIRVRAMQRATDHLLRHYAGEPTAPAWRDCTDEGKAWRQFVDIVNAALGEFHVRVEVGGVGVPEDTLGGLYPTLYEVAMLQLVNDLATEETFRQCANETCQRTFVRQLGRSRYYSRAAGVRYCSRTCANQQTQREYYRRKRAERNGR
jgi:hypothetical protein